MERWIGMVMAVTVIVTLTRYLLGHNKSSLKEFLIYSVGTSFALGVLFATISSLVIKLFL